MCECVGADLYFPSRTCFLIFRWTFFGPTLATLEPLSLVWESARSFVFDIVVASTYRTQSKRRASFILLQNEQNSYCFIYVFRSLFPAYSPVHRPKNFMLLHAPLQNHKKISLVKLKIMKLVLAGWFFCRKKSYRVVRCKVFFLYFFSSALQNARNNNFFVLRRVVFCFTWSL